MGLFRHRPREQWATRIGVILAVSGSAIGLGNFLRFPGQAAQYGGGSFMIPYIIAFLILGLPIAWVEWSMGRYGGSHGYNSAPGVFRAVTGRRYGTYFGILGPIIPVMIYMYYVFIEAWCLGYAWFYLTGQIDQNTDTGALFASFTGIAGDGTLFTVGNGGALIFMAACFALNFFLIYRGLNKGIEWFCKFAMPALFLIAFIVLIRVLTLGAPIPDKPEQNVLNGLGYMWNPVHQAENLAPGDENLQALIKRSAADAVTDVEDEDRYRTFKILDPGAMSWALDQTGWEPDALAERVAETRQQALQRLGNNDAKNDSLEVRMLRLSGRYANPAAPATALRIYPDGTAVFRGIDDEQPFLDVAVATELKLPHIANLLRILPVEAATPLQDDESTLNGFQVSDRDKFAAALDATGWTAIDPDSPAPLYQHDKSRLQLQANETGVSVRIPTFAETLSNPEIWLAAAGQIFFSLSIGFGIVITYSSYMKRDDDVALSSVTAAAGNGFVEVVLAGLTIIPATFIFLGVSTVANPPGTFGMGFVTLPKVFVEMPAGRLFGFLFFFLLFLAAVTSSLSMLQPAIALLEEGLGLGRKASVALLGFITAIGSTFIVYFSGGATAIDTIDFWIGTFCIYVMATIQVVVFAWVLGMDRGMAELNRGALIQIPGFIRFIIKYVSPTFLLIIFGFWLVHNAPGYAKALITIPEEGPPVIQLSIGLIVLVALFFIFVTMRANKRWDELEKISSASAPKKEDQS